MSNIINYIIFLKWYFNRSQHAITVINVIIVLLLTNAFNLNKLNWIELNWNIKVICSYVHTSVYDKRDDFGFPIVNFPWLSVDVPRLPSYGVYISHLVRFVRIALAIRISILKKLQITSELLTQCHIYHKLYYRPFLEHCTLTKKAVGTKWRALSKRPQRRQGPDPRLLWLLVGTPSAAGPELACRLRVAQPT